MEDQDRLVVGPGGFAASYAGVLEPTQPVAFPLSGDASFATGSAVLADGGLTVI